VHPLVPAVLFGMAWFDPLDLDPEAQPPDRQFAQAVGMSRPLLKFGGGSVEILRDVLH
jgi:hypothetical protein